VAGARGDGDRFTVMDRSPNDRAGRRQLREGEISGYVAQQQEHAVQQQAEIAALRRRLEELERR